MRLGPWLVFAAFLLLSATLPLVAYLTMGAEWFSLLFSALVPWLFAFLTMLYHSSPKFYLLVRRVLAYAANASTTWTLTADFGPCEQVGLAKIAQDCIQKAFPSARIWQNDATSKVLALGKLTVRLKEVGMPGQVGGEHIVHSLAITTGAITIPYRGVAATIDKTVAPLLERLGHALQTSDSKYAFRIEYDDGNPFFGLYVRRLPRSSLVRFGCEVKEDFSGQSVFVTIGRDNTTVVASTLSGVCSVAKKYLLLSAGVP